MTDKREANTGRSLKRLVGRQIGERCVNCINSRPCGAPRDVVCVSAKAFEAQAGRAFIGGAAGPAVIKPWDSWCACYERKPDNNRELSDGSKGGAK